MQRVSQWIEFNRDTIMDYWDGRAQSDRAACPPAKSAGAVPSWRQREPELPLIEPAPQPVSAKRKPSKGRTLPLDHPERPRNRAKPDPGKYLYPTRSRPKRGVNFVTDARHMEEPGLTAGLFLPVVSRGTSAATRAGDRSRALAELAMPLLGCY